MRPKAGKSARYGRASHPLSPKRFQQRDMQSLAAPLVAFADINDKTLGLLARQIFY
jgi:hypothetical protein